MISFGFRRRMQLDFHTAAAPTTFGRGAFHGSTSLWGVACVVLLTCPCVAAFADGLPFPKEVPNINVMDGLFPPIVDHAPNSFLASYSSSSGLFRCQAGVTFTGNLTFGRRALNASSPNSTVLNCSSTQLGSLADVADSAQALHVSEANYYFGEVWDVEMVDGCSIQKPIAQRMFQPGGPGTNFDYMSQNDEGVISPLVLTFDLPSMALASLRNLQRGGFHVGAPAMGPAASDPPIPVTITIRDANVENTLVRIIGFSDAHLRGSTSGDSDSADVVVGGTNASNRHTAVGKQLSQAMLEYLIRRTQVNVSISNATVRTFLDGREISKYFSMEASPSLHVFEEEFNRQFQFLEQDGESAATVTLSGVFPARATIRVDRGSDISRYLMPPIITPEWGLVFTTPNPASPDSKSDSYNSPLNLLSQDTTAYRGCGLSALRFSSAVFLNESVVDVVGSKIRARDDSGGDQTLMAAVTFQNFERVQVVDKTKTQTTIQITSTMPRAPFYNNGTNRTVTPTPHMYSRVVETVVEVVAQSWTIGTSIEQLLVSVVDLATLRRLDSTGSTFPTIGAILTDAAPQVSSFPAREIRRIEFSQRWYDAMRDALLLNFVSATTQFSELEQSIFGMHSSNLDNVSSSFGRLFAGRNTTLSQSSSTATSFQTIREVIGGSLSMALLGGSSLTFQEVILVGNKYQQPYGTTLMTSAALGAGYTGTQSVIRMRPSAVRLLCLQCFSTMVVQNSTFSVKNSRLRVLVNTQRYGGNIVNASMLTLQRRSILIVEGGSTVVIANNTLISSVNQTGFTLWAAVDSMYGSSLLLGNNASLLLVDNDLTQLQVQTATIVCARNAGCSRYEFADDVKQAALWMVRSGATVSVDNGSALMIANNTYSVTYTSAASTQYSYSQFSFLAVYLGNVTVSLGSVFGVAGNTFNVSKWTGISYTSQYESFISSADIYRSLLLASGSSSISVSNNRFFVTNLGTKHSGGGTMFNVYNIVLAFSSLVVSRNWIQSEASMDVYLRVAADTVFPPRAPIVNETLFGRARGLLLRDVCLDMVALLGDVHVGTGMFLLLGALLYNRTLVETGAHQCDSILYQLGELTDMSHAVSYPLNSDSLPVFPDVEGGAYTLASSLSIGGVNAFYMYNAQIINSQVEMDNNHVNLFFPWLSGL